MAEEERATGRRQAPSLRHRQISVSRSLRKEGPGMFWKMACQERQCRLGGANSMPMSGAPWSNSCVLYMAHRSELRTMINLIVIAISAIMLALLLVWWRWPALRAWIEAPKYSMLRQERRFDHQLK